MMNRLILILAAALVALIFADYLTLHRRDGRRIETSELRPLLHSRLEIVPDRVRQIRLQLGDRPQVWTYVKRGRTWRYPEYFDAFVRDDRIDFLLRSLLESLGTFVSADEDEYDYGLEPHRALMVGLDDRSGNKLLEVWIGRGVPNARAGEVFVRRAVDDSVFRWHANPRQVIDAGNPPLLDRLVLPRGLSRKPFVKLLFKNGESGSVSSLRRDELPLEGTARVLSGPRTPGPSYAWLVTVDGGENTCIAENVYAYTSFLKRLKYKRLNDPAMGSRLRQDGGVATRTLELTDEDGVVDILEVGAGGADGDVLIRHQSSGLVYTIAKEKASLLFPNKETLVDSLANTSGYRETEP